MLYGAGMNLTPSKQWAQWAVLLAVLVSAPGAAREPQGSKADREGQAGPWADCPADDGKAVATIRQTAPQTYEVIPARADRPVYCEARLQARIVPAFREGVPLGFKLFAIRSGSLYERAGLRNGDIVRSLNGMDLSSPEKALEAYRTQRNASRIEAEIEREGKLITLTYLVKEQSRR